MSRDRQGDDNCQDELPVLHRRLQELEQLNAKLRESEKRFQLLFEHAPDAYYLSDLKGTLVDGNATAERLTGYKRDELVGSSFRKSKLLSPKDLLKAASLLARNTLGRSTGPDEFTLIRKDGASVPVEITTHPVTINGRRLVLGIARDISARRRAERELRERVKELEAFYRLSAIAEEKGASLNDLCQAVADALPKSWTYDEIACARIMLRGREFRSANCARSEWKQSASVRARGAEVGSIDVLYLAERPARDEGPFLKEERRLIEAIAERLGRIVERKEAEEALRASEQRYRTLFEETHDAIALADAETGVIVDCNAAMCRMLERDRAELVGQPQSILHPPRDQEDGMTVASRDYIRDAVGHPIEEQVISKAGKLIPVEIRATTMEIEGRSCLLGIFRDITKRKELEDRLAHMARHDPLTGALNRYALDELLEREVARAKRYARPISFLMIDVNRFKEINDRFGHAMGDKVLQGVADVLRQEVRESDLVVRYGGDEFLIVLPETNGETDLVRDRILAEVARRNETNPLLDFPVTLAIGSVHWAPGMKQPIDHMLEEADRRMYEDKRGTPAAA